MEGAEKLCSGKGLTQPEQERWFGEEAELWELKASDNKSMLIIYGSVTVLVVRVSEVSCTFKLTLVIKKIEAGSENGDSFLAPGCLFTPKACVRVNQGLSWPKGRPDTQHSERSFLSWSREGSRLLPPFNI